MSIFPLILYRLAILAIGLPLALASRCTGLGMGVTHYLQIWTRLELLRLRGGNHG